LTDPAEVLARDAATILIFEKGIEHEKQHLASLKARGRNVVEVPGEGFDIAKRMALTREVMREGGEVIYQAALVPIECSRSLTARVFTRSAVLGIRDAARRAPSRHDPDFLIFGARFRVDHEIGDCWVGLSELDC